MFSKQTPETIDIRMWTNKHRKYAMTSLSIAIEFISDHLYLLSCSLPFLELILISLKKPCHLRQYKTNVTLN